jgi:pyruvate/2-oxoglutarate dehydrogenase complex dihydrolipoamide acyltransferase (E2) component
MPALSTETEAGTLSAWLKKPGETVQHGEVIARVATSKGSVDVSAPSSGIIERLLVPVGNKATTGSVLAVIRNEGSRSGDATSAQQGELERQAILKVLEAEMEKARQAQAAASTAQTAEQRARQAELERALTDVARAGSQDAALTSQKAELRAQAELKRELVAQMAHAGKMTDTQVEAQLRLSADLRETMSRLRELQSQDPEILARRIAERETMARQQAELAKQATITMQQAIQIATSQTPGTVLESRLVRERNLPCYVLTILSDTGGETTTTRVLISGIDGSVIKATKQ